jgi:hypothetical protein
VQIRQRVRAPLDRGRPRLPSRCVHGSPPLPQKGERTAAAG